MSQLTQIVLVRFCLKNNINREYFLNAIFDKRSNAWHGSF